MLKYPIFVLVLTVIMTSAKPLSYFNHHESSYTYKIYGSPFKIVFEENLISTMPKSIICTAVEKNETLIELCREHEEFREHWFETKMQYIKSFADKVNEWNSLPKINLLTIPLLAKIDWVRTG